MPTGSVGNISIACDLSSFFLKRNSPSLSYFAEEALIHIIGTLAVSLFFYIMQFTDTK